MSTQAISIDVVRVKWIKKLRLHCLEWLIGMVERDQLRHLRAVERQSALVQTRMEQAEQIAALIRREI
jgi:hypothetical protein